jgi:hypothetical protein
VKATLRVSRDEWIALGPAVEAMAFDFADWRANMVAAEVPLRLRFDYNGVWNAIAFWFELELDEETRLSTSPYGNKVSRPPVRPSNLLSSRSHSHRTKRAAHRQMGYLRGT